MRDLQGGCRRVPAEGVELAQAHKKLTDDKDAVKKLLDEPAGKEMHEAAKKRCSRSTRAEGAA